MSGAQYIDKICVDLTDAALEHRAELWSNYLRTNFDVALVGGSAATHPPRANSWLLGNVFLSDIAFGSAVMHRRKQHTRHDHDGFLWLEVRRAGMQQNEFGSDSFKALPGDVTLLDYSSEYRGRSYATNSANIIISHTAVGYDPGRHPKFVRFPADSVVGRVLRSTVLNLTDVLNCTTKAEADAISQGLLGLLRGLLIEKAGTVSPSFTAARDRTIRDYIERNLGQRKLNADVISAEFHVSRATVYRNFKEDGGLERYIMARKLEAALHALSFGPMERGVVSRAAERWGFSSTWHFSREFRRRFGFFPREVVGAGHSSSRSQDYPLAVHDEQELHPVESYFRRLRDSHRPNLRL